MFCPFLSLSIARVLLPAIIPTQTLNAGEKPTRGGGIADKAQAPGPETEVLRVSKRRVARMLAGSGSSQAAAKGRRRVANVDHFALPQLLQHRDAPPNPEPPTHSLSCASSSALPGSKPLACYQGLFDYIILLTTRPCLLFSCTDLLRIPL